ncbi:pyridoxal-phosphate dependent enzyme, partial [Trichothermofontia sp.]
GGTLTGAGRYLKQQNSRLQIIAVEPTTSAVLSHQPAGLHNIQGIGAGFIPDVLRVDLIDEIIPVADEDAYTVSRQLAKMEGIISGISTGAILYAAFQVGQRSPYRDRPIVAFQPSGGERYLSTPLFAESTLAASIQ